MVRTGWISRYCLRLAGRVGWGPPATPRVERYEPVIYSKLLAIGNISTATYKTVYTTPGSHTTIVKNAALWQSAASNVTFELQASGSGAVALLATPVLQQNVVFILDTWQVLPPGYSLRVKPQSAVLVYYMISGSELEGLPPTPTVPTMSVVSGTLPAEELPPGLLES